MEHFDPIFTYISNCFLNIPTTITVVIIATTAIFLLQMWLRLYSWGVPKRNKYDDLQSAPPISVILVLHENDEFYVQNYLSIILEQKYHQFEVVVVDCSYNEYIAQHLSRMEKQNYNLRVTTMRSDIKFDHGIKLALNVGIKTAQYEHLLITTSSSYPASENWISAMAAGFKNPATQIVIGYSTAEKEKGIRNRFVRCSRLFKGMGYLRAAQMGHAFYGSRHNIAYTKSVYFANRGYTHLNMNIGENDLFIQRIARNDNSDAVVNPDATVLEFAYGSTAEMFDNDIFYSAAFPMYSFRAKMRRNAELWSRSLFFLGVIILAIWLIYSAMQGVIIPEISIFVASLVLIRLLTILICKIKAGRRLADRGLWFSFIIYDLLSPLYDLAVWIRRSFYYNPGIWR